VSASVAQLRPDVDPLASLDPVLLHALTTHAHEVVSIVDRGGRVLFSGGAIERVFGYAPDERQGRPVLDVVHPDDVDHAQSTLREFLSDDASHPADPVAVRLRHKSGEYRHCEITGTRLQRAGATALLVLHTRDVTAPAQSMLEHMPAGVVLLDAQRRLRCANPLLGRLFPGAATGSGFEACFDPRSRAAVAGALARSRDESSEVEVEGVAPAAPQLAGRSYRVHVAPVASGSGFDGWCAIVRDVTQSRDTELKSFAAIGRDPQRIGHELHDGVGQQLTGAVLLAQTLATELGAERHRLAADVERVARLLNQSIDDVRMLARSLSPVGSAPTGLRAAMHSLAARARSLGELVVDLHLAIQPGHGLSAVESDHLYWIAQEAVVNAMRHAAARRLELSLEIAGEGFELQVTDDGRGTGAADAAARESGLGLRLMMHRARGLGANLSVTPRPGGGTRVSCVRRSRSRS
jgi:PAS domain S-box-containing protein